MSDDSFMPSSEGNSDGLGVTWCLSQAHQPIYDDRKRQRRAERRDKEEKENLKRLKLEPDTEQFIKQEPLSPCVTPRPTALKANERLLEQYGAALNSDMGENTFVEKLIEEHGTPSRNAPPVRALLPVRGRSPVRDETDLDLLRMRCLDAEAERDDALEARDETEESMRLVLMELDEVRLALQQVTGERDVALAKQKEWEKASRSAHHLVSLASEVGCARTW
ncbi:hypothetical protein C8F04DRAFT_1243863 [Mycena alexandri]|uniref:Uncharacterized protein n=1 Tax=Mycena alexandri TaxID=1745969 RepID=A0AAD6RYE1_9AGAR|nr:hypothetical protein C8F04DRAFT_1243863 [Mycena alexandri]